MSSEFPFSSDIPEHGQWGFFFGAWSTVFQVGSAPICSRCSILVIEFNYLFKAKVSRFIYLF